MKLVRLARTLILTFALIWSPPLVLADQLKPCPGPFASLAEISVKQISHAKERWSAISRRNPPADVPFFALGTFGVGRLEAFASRARRTFEHDVFHISGDMDLSEKRSIEALGQFAMIHQKSQHDELRMMREIVALSPNNKVLLVNLQGITIEKLIEYRKIGGPLYLNRTNREIDFILKDKDLFDHTRWFQNGRELSFEELQRLFEPLEPELFH